MKLEDKNKKYLCLIFSVYFVFFNFSLFSELKITTINGKDYINLNEMVKTYGGTSGKDEISKYPFWIINGHRVVFSTNTPTVSVDSKIVHLKLTPIEKDGNLFLGNEFPEAVFPFLNIKFEKEEKEKIPPKEDSNIQQKETLSEIVKTKVDISYDLIRVTFEGTMVTFSEVKKTDNAIIVKIPRGKLETKETNLGEGIATRIFLDSTLKEMTVFLDTNFKSFETIKLKNPERFVLLLKGSGQKTSVLKEETKSENKPQTFSDKPFEKKRDSILVVIDPGHGGNDTGAIAKNGIMEKDLTLLYATKLKEALEKEGIDVILTRNSDTFILLKERTSIANFNKADLFISIHFNSSPFKNVKGSESYIMSKDASDLWSKELAEKENAQPPGEGETKNEINLILWNLAQNQYIVESASVAGELQGSLNQLFGTKDRGVRQAPFAVLEGAMMPAILLEVCFLSNQEESLLVKDNKFVDNVVSAVKGPILRFKERNAPPTNN